MPKRSVQAQYLGELLTRWAGVPVTVGWESAGVARGQWWARWADGPSVDALRVQALTQARWVAPLPVAELRYGREYTPPAWALALLAVAEADPQVTDWHELEALAESWLFEAGWPGRSSGAADLATAGELAGRCGDSVAAMARAVLEGRVAVATATDSPAPPAQPTASVTFLRDVTGAAGSRAGRRCAHCGGPVTAAATGRPPRWCSAACRQAAYRARHTGETEQRDETRCGACGGPVPTAATGRPALWCSPACRTRAWRARAAGSSAEPAAPGRGVSAGRVPS